MKRVVLLPLVLTLACASFLLGSATRMERGRADLERKTARIERFQFVYLEGGQGPTILLLHGFGGDKDNWTRFARYLTPAFHVVAPDLPGFGENDRHADADYGVSSQVERVRAFARELGLDRPHIVGNSMGGAIAGLYAARYPGDVRSLGLFNAAGIESPRKSEAHRIVLETGRNPLLVDDAADFDRFLKFAFVEPPPMPGSVKAYFAERAVANRPFNEMIFSHLRKEPFPLARQMRNIKAPTLILWGDTDRIIDPSSVDVLRKGIRGSRVAIMEKCGHVPMVERPEETATIYRDFLDQL